MVPSLKCSGVRFGPVLALTFFTLLIGTSLTGFYLFSSGYRVIGDEDGVKRKSLPND